MITIFSAEICPFAQRTRAFLEHLRQPYELREVDLDNRDPELLRQSPTGEVPFLVDGDVMLFESRVINDYLAARLGHEHAYSRDPELRALQQPDSLAQFHVAPHWARWTGCGTSPPSQSWWTGSPCCDSGWTGPPGSPRYRPR